MVEWRGMGDIDFYIDRVPEASSDTEEKPKPMKDTWWEYGLTLAVIQVVMWLMVGFRNNPEYSFSLAFRAGSLVYGMFIFFGFFPFFLARIGLTRMRWFTLVGVILGIGSYHLLSSFEPTRRFSLLPFISYLQFSFAGVSLGFLWEFGRWVFKKLKQ